MKVGDVVCFKSDIEQCGRIVQIKAAGYMGSRMFVLESTRPEGFDGDYIGGAQFTEELEADCWVEYSNLLKSLTIRFLLRSIQTVTLLLNQAFNG